MNYIEAIQAMQQGQFITRSRWNEFYLGILPFQRYVWQIAINPKMENTVNACIYVPANEDILATDWKIR